MCVILDMYMEDKVVRSVIVNVHKSRCMHSRILF